jgi:hypothetical protein
MLERAKTVHALDSAATVIGSYHPYEHKYQILITQRTECTYPITKEAKEKELNIIHDKLHNNEYNKNLSTIYANQRKHNKNTGRQHKKTKYAIFTQ